MLNVSQLAAAVLNQALKDYLAKSSRPVQKKEAIDFLCGDLHPEDLTYWCELAGFNCMAVISKARRVRDGREVFRIPKESQIPSQTVGGIDSEGIEEARETHVGSIPA